MKVILFSMVFLSFFGISKGKLAKKENGRTPVRFSVAFASLYKTIIAVFSAFVQLSIRLLLLGTAQYESLYTAILEECKEEACGKEHQYGTQEDTEGEQH